MYSATIGHGRTFCSVDFGVIRCVLPSLSFMPRLLSGLVGQQLFPPGGQGKGSTKFANIRSGLPIHLCPRVPGLNERDFDHCVACLGVTPLGSPHRRNSAAQRLRIFSASSLCKLVPRPSPVAAAGIGRQTTSSQCERSVRHSASNICSSRLY
jgi:hypothetical protein